MLRQLQLILLLLLPSALIADCTPPFYGYQFLNPDLLEYDSQLGPLYQSFAGRYGIGSFSEAEIRKRDNLAV